MNTRSQTVTTTARVDPLVRCTVRSLGLPAVQGEEEYVARVLGHPLSYATLTELRTVARWLGVTAELKEQVTSPGGTTAAGLQVMEAAAIRSILIQSVKAATQRSEKLSSGGH